MKPRPGMRAFLQAFCISGKGLAPNSAVAQGGGLALTVSAPAVRNTSVLGSTGTDPVVKSPRVGPAGGTKSFPLADISLVNKNTHG